jgi:hypothetical protein
MKKTQVARLLAYVTGIVNQQLLLENEYLIAENRILRSHLSARLRLTDPQRATLAAIAKRLGRQALEQVALVAKPETILGWYRKLIAQKFDRSKHRVYPGRPTSESGGRCHPSPVGPPFVLERRYVKRETYSPAPYGIHTGTPGIRSGRGVS